MHMYASIWSRRICLPGLCVSFFLRSLSLFLSPMIAREGDKISRTSILYLYCRAPPQGDDEMSNRSPGTSTAHIDDQYNTVLAIGKKKNERTKTRRKKSRQIAREQRRCVSSDLSSERIVLIGRIEKRDNVERDDVRTDEGTKKKISPTFSLLFFLLSRQKARSEWLENIIISSNDNATGAKGTTGAPVERKVT